MARRAATISAADLPAHPFRIRKLAEAQLWECQRATLTARNYVIIGKPTGRIVDRGPLWSPAEYEADRRFAPLIAWTRIGPLERRGGRDPNIVEAEAHSWTRGPQDARAKATHSAPGLFSTFPEAERWLGDLLRPAPDITYFDAAGGKAPGSDVPAGEARGDDLRELGSMRAQSHPASAAAVVRVAQE